MSLYESSPKTIGENPKDLTNWTFINAEEQEDKTISNQILIHTPEFITYARDLSIALGQRIIAQKITIRMYQIDLTKLKIRAGRNDKTKYENILTRLRLEKLYLNSYLRLRKDFQRWVYGNLVGKSKNYMIIYWCYVIEGETAERIHEHSKKIALSTIKNTIQKIDETITFSNLEEKEAKKNE